MITQAVFNFNIERTEKNITANAGLSFLARYIHGLGINQLADTYLPLPGNAKGYKPSEYVDTTVYTLDADATEIKQIPFYENCVRNMPTGKRIGYYRADSACYQSALINRLEKDTVRIASSAGIISAAEPKI